MKTIAFIITVLLITACRTQVPIHSSDKDSTRIEYRERIKEVLRTDTVFLEIPIQEKETMQKDSSFLDTDFATSMAKITSSGLFHNLKNKARSIPKQVIVKDSIIMRDSVIYRDREKVTEVAVRLPLTWWQNFWMRAGQVLTTVAIIFLLLLILKLTGRLSVFGC